MKIHYMSCHSVLEYNEVKLFTELGHDVFSNGAYLDPAGHISLPRPGIDGAKKWSDEMISFARNEARTNLPQELIDPFDVIIVMHTPDLIVNNWEKIKHKRVIWRTIGQSVGNIEKRLKPMRDEGLEIVRYSPKEVNIANYLGSDALIRFYKDQDVFNGWVGDSDKVVNFSQSLKGRGPFCHYNEIVGSIIGFNAKVYGTGNEDLGELNGGNVGFEKMLDILRDARVAVYGGTWPASYTLSIIEYMMLGIPVVAASKKIAHMASYEKFNFYEVDEIIEDKVSGFVCDTVQEMRHCIEQLINNYDLAKKISANSRARAIELFGKEKIAEQWREFLER